MRLSFFVREAGKDTDKGKYMAFGRKNKGTGRTSASSRYEDGRYLEYGDDLPENDLSSARRAPGREAGYGVNDSYLRQNEFGRPEGSAYDRIREEDLAGRPAASARDARHGQSAAFAHDARRGQSAASARDARRSQSVQKRPERWRDDPYDDRYEGSYEGFDSYGNEVREQAGSRRTYRDQEPYRSRRADQYEDDRRSYGSRRADQYEDDRGSYRDRRDLDEREYSEGVRKRGGRKKSKRASFTAKLVLLIIAAVVIFGSYRFLFVGRNPLGSVLKNEGVSSQKGFQNFVIYGVDSREGELTKDSHSDTIVICSINKSTNEAKMVSVYRDTYLDNTNGEYRKATECYFFGGPERSINMLNKNFDLDIEDYIAVNFNAVIKAVDLIGGVDINVTEDELPYINGYQTENAQVTGAQITPVESAGYQHLNGIQALAYCRIRYTAGDDYKRTERQRTVLTQVFDNAKKQGTAKMLQMVNALMPYISTSFSDAELVNLVKEMGETTLGDSTGFPFEQQPADIAAGDCVVPVNLAQNVRELHSFLFNQNDYTPSQTVQDISQTIINNTGIS